MWFDWWSLNTGGGGGGGDVIKRMAEDLDVIESGRWWAQPDTGYDEHEVMMGVKEGLNNFIPKRQLTERKKNLEKNLVVKKESERERELCTNERKHSLIERLLSCISCY